MNCPYLQLPLDDPIFGKDGRLTAITSSSASNSTSGLTRWLQRLPRFRSDGNTGTGKVTTPAESEVNPATVSG